MNVLPHPPSLGVYHIFIGDLTSKFATIVGLLTSLANFYLLSSGDTVDLLSQFAPLYGTLTLKIVKSPINPYIPQRRGWGKTLIGALIQNRCSEERLSTAPWCFLFSFISQLLSSNHLQKIGKLAKGVNKLVAQVSINLLYHAQFIASATCAISIIIDVPAVSKLST